MIETANAIFILALLAIPLSWALPSRWAMDGVAMWSFAVLLFLAPFATGWLLATTLLIPPAMRLGERFERRGLIASVWVLLLLAGFVAARTVSGPVWIGVAFFTLRHLHVIGDWWMGKCDAPAARNYLRYQFFLPVIVIGPIGRIQRFEREMERRRWDASDFLEGAERVLIGSFMAVVLGGWIFARMGQEVDYLLVGGNSFLRDWAASAMGWVTLYFQFAGLSAVALGMALMMGLRLEENFNRPWAAKTLLDFWTRWHMTLAKWVMDYVYRPVMALSRNAFVGLAAAMLAIGLWHEFSVYYVLWSCWQVLGILLTRLALKYFTSDADVPRAILVCVREVLLPLIVLAWLSLSRPIIERLLEMVL